MVSILSEPERLTSSQHSVTPAEAGASGRTFGRGSVPGGNVNRYARNLLLRDRAEPRTTLSGHWPDYIHNQTEYSLATQSKPLIPNSKNASNPIPGPSLLSSPRR
jgi:hypothetical protein